MKSETKLHFSTNAKLGKLIGRELITNNIAAVFELIKNSYDAFATEVSIEFINFNIIGDELFRPEKGKTDEIISRSDSEIIILDNGIGMTLDEIQKNWMVIGATNKENATQWENTKGSRKIIRTINGEKGIGRFGCDRLGSILSMTSIGGDGSITNRISIDWNAFDEHDKKIEDIDIIVHSEKNEINRKTGLELRISGLRDQWTRGDIQNIIKQLRKLISPFKQEQSDFSIVVKLGDYSEKIRNESFEYAASQILGKLSKDGQLTYRIKDQLSSYEQDEMIKPPSFGPVEFRILYLDAVAKRKFAKNNGISSREYGNIKLFRDDFRILPYGEVENDWLGIDNAHAQQVFRTLGTRDIMGYVQITKVDNAVLKDATNRQGLNEDTKEFIEFKDFIWSILTIFQKHIFDKIKEEAIKKGKSIKENVQDIKQSIQDIREHLPEKDDKPENETLVQASDIAKALSSLGVLESNITKVEKANDQMNQRIAIMEKIVGTETLLYDMLHSIKNKLDSLTAYAQSLKNQAAEKGLVFDEEDFTRLVSEISKITLAALKRSSPYTGERKHISLANIIKTFINEQTIVYTDICFETENLLSDPVYINISGIRNVFDNLLSNSRKAFVEGKDKRIRISMDKNDNGNIRVFFEDNGKAIADENIPYIFNVSFSRTGGTGIGLANCLQIMRECKGDISYVKNSALGGACFVMTFAKR